MNRHELNTAVSEDSSFGALCLFQDLGALLTCPKSESRNTGLKLILVALADMLWEVPEKDLGREKFSQNLERTQTFSEKNAVFGCLLY